MLGSSVDKSFSQDSIEPTTYLLETVDDVSLASPILFPPFCIRGNIPRRMFDVGRRSRRLIYTLRYASLMALKSLELLVLGM